MLNRKNVFSEDIELSEIVLEKTNHAFEMIKKEGNDYMKKTNIETNDKDNVRSGKLSNRAREVNPIFHMRGPVRKTQAAVIAGICILVISSISAAAAIRHYWGRGIIGYLQATDEQQQELVDKNIAKVYDEASDQPAGQPPLAITDNGITIKPDTIVVDERFAYMSFSISGYSVAQGEEPGFGSVGVYLGDDPEAESGWVNMSGRMYDGVIPDENGMPVYEDGSPLQSDEQGHIISHYTDSNGNMEYILQARSADKDDSLLGKTMHVNFENLGTLYKAEFSMVLEGKWNFELTLPDVSSSQNIKLGKKIEGTGFVIDDIDISPISMKVNYSVNEPPVIHEDENGIPVVMGVVLKDGTSLPYLADGGGSGYTDSSMTKAYQITGYDRVIDVGEVAALIVLTSYGGERVEIPIG